MRRRPGTLLPLEVSILRITLESRAAGEDGIHGYLLAARMKEGGESRTLTAHGTLYKALDRLRTSGLLESWWEDPAVAAADERPRRRLYRISAEGVTALGEAQVAVAPRVQRGAAPA